MKINLKGRDFLKLLDFSTAELQYLLKLSAELKHAKKSNTEKQYLQGKNIVLIFEKTSTRTRCAFEVAAFDQGAHVTYIGSSDSQIGLKESIADTARVLARMYDGIEFRGFKHSDVEILARYASVPVWNGLTNEFHPTQILADFLTIQETFGSDLTKKKLVYYGDGRNNVANSLMIGCARMGMDFVICGPENLWPEKNLIEQCQEIAKDTKATITFITEPLSAAKNADVIYTDVWVSMGEPSSVWKERINLLKPYQVNKTIMKAAKKTAIFMHCLPAYHNVDTVIGKKIGNEFNLTEFEVTEEVFESQQTKSFDQSENRLHTIKAIMVATL